MLISVNCVINRNRLKMSGLMLDDVKVSMQKFGVPDYLVFVMMLVLCALIGVYFGFFEKKPAKKCDEESDYLVGGRQMKVIPITMSLIARYVQTKEPLRIQSGNKGGENIFIIFICLKLNIRHAKSLFRTEFNNPV